MLPVPFGRQVSFPQGQGSPEHAGCWALCLGLGTSLGAKLEDSITITSGRKGLLATRSNTRLGASDTSAIKCWRRAQAGQGTERISRQGCPQWFLSALGWDLSYKPGAKGSCSQWPEDEPTKHWGDTDTNTSPQPTTTPAARAAPATSYRHPHPSQLPGARTGSPHSFLPESFPVPAPLLKTNTQHLARSSDCCLPHTQPSTPAAQLFHLIPLQPHYALPLPDPLQLYPAPCH